MNKAPNCYECEYRGNIIADAHSCCHNKKAKVVGSPYGKKNGWFMHPVNFDPAWLISCTGFKQKKVK